MSAGINVDIVSSKAFLWQEIEDESFDYVLSTSTFEHNPFFWVTFAEIARVLKQGGKTLITAPAAGIVHRYPVDCWRFYPDSWGVLCTLTGLTVDEVISEPFQSLGVLPGAQWWDSSIVASKPAFDNARARTEFYERLKPLVEPYGEFGPDFKPVEVNKGPLFRAYLRRVVKEQQRQRDTPSGSAPQPDYLRNHMRSAMRPI